MDLMDFYNLKLYQGRVRGHTERQRERERERERRRERERERERAVELVFAGP